MSRNMIEIVPGTESWDAWMKHHRGTKTELVMVKCRHDARPFYAWSEMPPAEEAVRQERLWRREAQSAETAPVERHNAESDVNAIAERLEARAERDEAETAARHERSEQQTLEAGAFALAISAVQGGQMPKVEELPDVGVVMIDDPFEVKRGRKAKPLRAKLVNLRDDPVGQMAKRGQIEPEQLSAARKWQALYDVAASIGGSRGIDPGAMKVDGGRFAEPINDVQMHAIKELEKLDLVLGLVGASLVRRVLGERMTLAQVAQMMGNTTARGVNNTGSRLRECLDTLVAVVGVETKGRRRRAPRDEAADLARYAENPLLYSAVHHAMARDAAVDKTVNQDKPTLGIKIV